MNADNPARDALIEHAQDQDYDIDLEKKRDVMYANAVKNGIRTCGPIVSAALSAPGVRIDDDINKIISAAKALIVDVVSTFKKKSIQLSDHEVSAINAFCIRVVSESWVNSQDMHKGWVDSVVDSLTAAGICAEIEAPPPSLEGETLAANISSSVEIFCALNSSASIPYLKEAHSECVQILSVSVEEAVNKLSKFNIPYEDTEQIRHHLTIQASKIFASVIRREFNQCHQDEQRTDISYDEICQHFKVAMDGFVFSIYTNSKMVN